MARTTDIMTVSLSQQLTKVIEKLVKEEGRTKSELVREALRQYAENREWKKMYRYAEMKAREKNITTEDQVDDLIHARRAKAA